MKNSSRSNGFIESSREIDPNDFLVGKPPIVCESKRFSPRKNKNIIREKDISDENELDFQYPTIRDIKRTPRDGSESSRPQTSRPTTRKYQKCHENDDVFTHAESILQRYDSCTQRKKYIMHEEYEAEVASPLQEKFRPHLTGRNYQTREASRLGSRERIAPLRINTAGVGDRIARSRLEAKKEARLEKMLSDIKPQKTTKKFEQDPKRLADTRFFGYSDPQRKGTKVFNQKFQSSVLSQIDNFS